MKFKGQFRTALLAGCASLAMAGTACAMDWSGLYLGVNGGGGVANDRSSNYYGAIDTQDWGGLLGGTAGFNWQVGPNVVVGAEGNMDWAGLDTDSGDTFGGYYRHKAEWNWLATVRGRAGIAVD